MSTVLTLGLAMGVSETDSKCAPRTGASARAWPALGAPPLPAAPPFRAPPLPQPRPQEVSVAADSGGHKDA